MLMYLLDMGTREYGDCIVVHNDEKKILIDGAHKGDSASLRAQFKKIFGHSAPFHFDLLVLTHLHDDHIGCLPELVQNGDITAGKCLLMDPEYRWVQGAIDSKPERSPFVDALLEEDHSFLSDSELEEFLLDSETLVVRYGRMINTLRENGAEVKLFRGSDADDYTDLENEFSSLGMKILGPTQHQLELTKEALLGVVDTLTDFVASSSFRDAEENDVARYRRLFSEGFIDNVLAVDAAKNKGSINNESIVLKFKSDQWSALVAGDMQFADAQVSGLEEEMERLLQTVNEQGPYDFIKTSHHSSDNGISQEMLEQWIEQGTEFYGHSGGLHDDHHPHPKVLTFMREMKDQIKFVRTDRNGLIKIGMDGDTLSMWVSKGQINNFAKNKKAKREDADEVVEIPANRETNENVRLQEPAEDTGGSHIQFSAIVPENRSVRIIIEVDGEKKN